MRLKRIVILMCLLATPLLLAVPDFAGAAIGELFEIDGNAVENGDEDWATYYGGGGSGFEFTGIMKDLPPKTIFNGGDKDILPIAKWGHKSGSVPDKDEILNAYAVGHVNASDQLEVYFGADRISNAGDAYLGFWFFKDRIIAKGDGTFEGEHQNGDTLVLVNFPQGAKANPLIQVVEWDTTCTRADSSKPSVGQCAATNLRLRVSDTGVNGGVSKVCNGAETVCAITNHQTETAPWPYESKDGLDDFPYETFFEGGINLSLVVGGGSCFSSFMAESRSSSSFTAQLKDFVLGEFDTCSISLVKECTNTTFNADETAFIHTFSFDVENTGHGDLYDVTLHDVTGSRDIDLGDLPIGGIIDDYTITFETTENELNNEAWVSASGTDGGEQTVISDTATAECPGMQVSPNIDVTKECNLGLLEEGDGEDARLVVKLEFSGQVCNLNDTFKLYNVQISDDQGVITSPESGLIGTLAKQGQVGDCKPYSGYYLPLTTDLPGGTLGQLYNLSDGNLILTDTVTATGDAPLGLGFATDTATDTCKLCPDCPTCPPSLPE